MFAKSIAGYYEGNDLRHTTVVDAKSLLSVSPHYCVKRISSENTNITTTWNLIRLQRVVQVQLDGGG